MIGRWNLRERIPIDGVYSASATASFRTADVIRALSLNGKPKTTEYQKLRKLLMR